MSKNSTIVALLKLKCPRCHKGKMFLNPSPFNLKTLDAMPEKCPCCGQRMETEPGFYFGAMYFSYAAGVVISLLNFVICQLILNLPGFWFLFVNAVVLLILWPFIFRYARASYLYLFVSYDPNAIDK